MIFTIQRLTFAIASIAAVIFLVALLGALVWEQSGPTLSSDISAETIQPLDEHAFAVVLPVMPWVWGGWGRHPAVLLEDSLPLAAPDSLQGDVVLLGAGRYLNPRPAELYFSTSDNSDPRTNGRTYTIQRLPGAPLSLFGILLAGLAFFVTLVLRPVFARAGQVLPAVLPYLIFVLVAIGWTLVVVSPEPQIIPNGDGGNVASIVAAQLHPDRFAEDRVFSRPQNFQFYITAMIPAVAGLTLLTGDIGTSYMMMSMPLILLQLVGFYLLGRELFGGRLWPVVLALISIPPVYVFSGELWGMLASALTRSAFAAVFPFLLLAGFRASRSWHVIPIMLACGATIYIHPVSAPSVALGIFVMLFAAKPPMTTWPRHTLWTFAGGCVFLLSIIPFALTSVRSATGAGASQLEVAKTLADTLRANVGDQYYSAVLAIRQFAETIMGTGLSWVSALWVLGAAAPIVLWWQYREQRSLGLVFFALGLGLGSFGVALADQSLAQLRGVEPYQIDLIRNIRFFVPLLLIALVWWAAKASSSTRPVPSALVPAFGVAVLIGWWMHFPTPFVSYARETLLRSPTVGFAPGEDERRVIGYIATLPPSSRVLPLPHKSNSEEVGNVALAIRYAALQPIAYLFKDMNFLTYSASSELQSWSVATRELDNAATDLTGTALRSAIELTNANYLLIHDSASPALKKSAGQLGDDPITFGAWTLVPIRKGL